MILPAGTFRVADHRKPIPTWAKLDALMLYVAEWFERGGAIVPIHTYRASEIEFDHEPALCFRDYDTEVGDFVPPQHDPKFIVPRPKPDHLEKTTGRKAGAERTVTTRGSDIGERARTRKIQANRLRFEAAMAAKGGDPAALAEALKPLADAARARPKPKRRIPSRPFNSKGKRKFGNGR